MYALSLDVLEQTRLERRDSLRSCPSVYGKWDYSQNVPLSKRPLVKTTLNWSKRPQNLVKTSPFYFINDIILKGDVAFMLTRPCL